MKLLHIFDRRDRKKGYLPIVYRNSVRAIIFKHGKLLMVHAKKTDEYKFPGGGIEPDEIREEALRREVLEEVGRKVNSVNESLGYTDQLYNDLYDERRYFYLRSYYYFCEVTIDVYDQNLNLYEQNLRFEPRWVTIDEAIEANKEVMAQDKHHLWTERELFILEMLKEMMS
ncbi:MAG: NUDIX domain-containing protein [Candidatus Izimaplasma sp.]|nr:NUDIX domain-containing protein [Candidatus Izimaplasma bacterium]